MNKTVKAASEFLTSLDNKFNMRPRDWLLEEIKKDESPLIIDFRSRDA